jgi:sentrin-specific protease 8
MATSRATVQQRANGWQVIAFWEEYLEREKLIHYPRAHIVLLRPSMSMMLAYSPNPRELRSALPDFSKTTHVFLPINDSRDPEMPESGSHWSLLLVSLIDGVAFHYDSLGGDNIAPARDVSRKLEMLLGRSLRFSAMMDTPQQENGSDCGVYVCLFLRTLLLDKLLTADSNARVSMTLRTQDYDAKKGRKEIKETIDGFRKEGERRRSRSVSPFGKKGDSKSPPRIGDE